MGRFLAKRLLYFVFVFLLVSFLMFFIYKLIPGDPVRMMLEDNKGVDPDKYQAMYDAMYIKLGLDKPLLVQYGVWITNLFKGDLGFSTTFRQPVVQVLPLRLKNTLILSLGQLIAVFAIAFPVGIRIAVKRNGLLDQGMQAFTIIGYSLPSFVIALISIYVLSIRLDIFPTSGMNSPGVMPGQAGYLWDRIWHMMLPIIVMTITGLGGIIRYVRAAMIDALSMDCIRTARAKGLSERVVIYSHAFRNALLPIITVVTFWFVGIFGGSVVIESFFSFNGMGKLMIDSLRAQDYSIVIAVQMMYVTLALIGNLVMDLLYGLADPRVKLD